MEPTVTQSAAAPGQRPDSLAIIHLLKGVVYRDTQPELWQDLERHRAGIADYFAVIGLELFIDPAEGYAFLRQEQAEDEEGELPRLIHRRVLSYPVSVLCVLFRKKLCEHDASGGDFRLVMDREQIADMVSVFMPDTENEAKIHDQLDANLVKMVKLGFLGQMKGAAVAYEVRRVLKALVPVEWLQDFDARLKEYVHDYSGV